MKDYSQMGLVSTHICKTRDVGNHGNLFGGVMLSWLDEAGAALAAEVAETGKIVTKHISALDFKSAVRPGQLIKIYGRVAHLGKTSLKIEIEARRHSVYNGTQKPVCKCEMVFVRIDGDGEAVPIAPHIRNKTAEQSVEQSGDKNG
jgi:acyl-CoA thioesterase YciA